MDVSLTSTEQKFGMLGEYEGSELQSQAHALALNSIPCCHGLRQYSAQWAGLI